MSRILFYIYEEPWRTRLIVGALSAACVILYVIGHRAAAILVTAGLLCYFVVELGFGGGKMFNVSRKNSVHRQKKC